MVIVVVIRREYVVLIVNLGSLHFMLLKILLNVKLLMIGMLYLLCVLLVNTLVHMVAQIFQLLSVVNLWKLHV